MKRFCILVLIGHILFATVSGCNGQSVITPEQAMDAVRAFEGDNTLQLTCDPIEEDLKGPEWAHERIYRVDDSEYTCGWTVDAVTSEVTWATYRDARPEVHTDEPAGPLTQEQCRQIAEDFARAKYAGFDTMGFESREPEWEGYGWGFTWESKNIYGAQLLSRVSVSVSPADGRVQFYVSRRLPVPMPPPQEPQISPGQAVQVVKNAKGLVTGAAESAPVLSANPDHTMWSFVLYGEDAQGQDLIYYAEVDAVTGAVIRTVEPMAGAHVPAPAARVASGVSTSLRELAAKVPGARVHWLGKEGARLFVGKSRYTLIPGKDTIEWTGGTIKLSAKMTLVNGRLMVPSGLLDVLKSAPAPKKAPPASAKSK